MILANHLARNVAALRDKRNLTQNGLAKLAGLPRSTITYIESGEGNPTLDKLVRLSGALQVGIEALLAQPRAEVALIRADQVPVQVRGDGRARLFKLLPDPLPGMEIDRIEIEPGGRLPGVPHLQDTKEYLTCVRGEVVVHMSGSAHHLLEGDVLAFPGDRPHAYQNPGTHPAVCLSVVVLASHG